MMRLSLAIDTSDRSAQLCLSAGRGSSGIAIQNEQRAVDGMSVEALPRMLGDSLTALGGRIDQIEKIVVALGPGSFTGIRGGVAFAQGISAALGIPVIGVSIHLARAHSILGAHQSALVATRASVSDYYLASASKGEVFTRLEGEIAPVCCDSVELSNLVFLDEINGADALIRFTEECLASESGLEEYRVSQQIFWAKDGIGLVPTYGKGVAARTLAERRQS